MKKIVSAAIIAAMATGFAMADAKITMNGRLRPMVFSSQTSDDGATETTETNWMSLDGVAAFEDTLKFAFNTEDKTAGLTFSVNIKNGNDTALTLAKKDGTDVKDEKIGNNKYGSFFTLNQYDVWSTVFGTDLKIGAGSWKDGNADGAYRVKKDVDAGNAEGVYFERFKLGSAFKSAPSMFVDDIVNFAGGSNALAAYAEYPWAINDDMNLKLTLVAVKADYDELTEDDETTNYKAGWVARAQFGMKNMFDSELIIKKPAHNLSVLAFYAKPKMLKELDATIGGSYTMGAGSNEKWDGAWDFDVRARYQVNDKLSITSFNKIAGLDEHADKTKNAANAAVNSGIAGVDGKQGIIEVGGKDVTTLMWNNLSGRYIINDAVTATLNVGLITVLGTASKSDSEYGVEYSITPGAQLYLSKNATLWAGFNYNAASYNEGTAGAKDQTVSSMSVPVIFRVKM